MATSRFDHWGNVQSYRGYVGNRPEQDPEPYIVDEATSGVVYLCYANTANRAIRRITTADSVTTIEWAYGAWADRATLTYHPINETIEVTE